MMRILLPLAATLLCAAPAAAQARYHPQPDTLYYGKLNPHRMYVVRGRDTLGPTVRAFSVERQVWRAERDGLVVELREQELDGPPATLRVVRLTPRGVVTATRDSSGADGRRWDFVLRLPADGVLEAGRVWHDTLDGRLTPDEGEFAFQVWRELRVERIADTLGSRVAIVRGRGRLRYRDTYSVGEGARWWIDVAGPTDETFLFDLRNGRMAAREWWMDLRGTAAFPRAGGRMDTVPAGLFSTDTTRVIGVERARLLTHGLPAGDTTRTSGTASFLHTVRAAGDTLESGYVRSDGLLITSRAVYRDGRTVRYEMIATEALKEPVRRRVEVAEGRMRVSGGIDTVIPLPSGAWVVSDYAMDEHLARAVARLARDGRDEANVAVFRPYPLRWDTIQVRLQPLDDAVAAWLENGDVVDLMILEKNGTLLYMERLASPGEVRRRPLPGSPREKRVEALIDAAIRALGGDGPRGGTPGV